MSYLKRFQVADDELGLIIEHFFKVGNVPPLIGGISMKPAADVIIHSASRHGAKSLESHLKRLLVLRPGIYRRRKLARQVSETLVCYRIQPFTES